jgi:hypothetical protein
LQSFQRLAVKLVDDIARCFRREEQSPPEGVIGIGEAGFQRRRDIRQGGSAFQAVDCEGEELAFADMRQDNSHRQNGEVDPSSHDFGNCFWAAFEGNMNGLESRTQTEALHTQVSAGPDTCRRECE